MRVARVIGAGLLAALAVSVSLVGRSWAHEDHPHASAAEADKEIQAGLAELAPADRAAAEAQRWCPMMPEDRLGAMGKPIKIILDGKPVFLCCAECEKGARANAKTTLAKVESLKKVNAALAKLSPADRTIAEAQRYCAVREKNELGSMGTPIKLVLDGQPVFLCCAGCKKAATANPKETLAKLKARKSHSEHDHEHD